MAQHEMWRRVVKWTPAGGVRWNRSGGVLFGKMRSARVLQDKAVRWMNVNSLGRVPANFQPLTPLTWLDRASKVYRDSPAIVDVDGSVKSWGEFRRRAVRLCSSLEKRGIRRGDVVQVLLDNTSEMLECHYGVPMSGACLGSMNTRLDAKMLGFILQHSQAKGFIYDKRHAAVAREAKKLAGIEFVFEAEVSTGDPNSYEALIEDGDPTHAWRRPIDEFDALSLNYTSGTTGNPKGVIGTHRGTYLTALGNTLAFGGMPSRQCRYLWTLPMFHCNGWTFPYAIAAVGGVNVCLRSVDAQSIEDAFLQHDITHLCGAPIVLGFATSAQSKVNASRLDLGLPKTRVKMMVAAAPPPPARLREADAAGIDVTHVYGLTEVYGPSTKNEWDAASWDPLDPDTKAKLRARQGVEYATCEDIDVVVPGTFTPVAHDGKTVGEVVFRGNQVMRGYFRNPEATAKAFGENSDWFHSGDLAVMHPDGYLSVVDRAKDIIISGGENIATIEIEDALVEHPDILLAAVVARPDDKWGETPCAFVEARPGSQVDEKAIIDFTRTKLAGFKIPKKVVFGPLPKTSTGKIQKFVLRERVKDLSD